MRLNKGNKEINKRFGENLRQIRQAKGFSMRGFASEADIDYSLLAKIETGKVSPTVSTVEKLADALGLKIKDLFDFPQ